MKKYTLLLILIFLNSCSLVNKKEEPFYLENYSYLTDSDFLDFYRSIGPVYRQLNQGNIIKLKSHYHEYLISIYNKLKKNNELLFDKKVAPTFYIILSVKPVHFSLPGGQYYLSYGLLHKYLKNEDLLVAVLAVETIRWQRSLYPKKIKVPIGYYTTEEIINLIRLPLKTKIEINKWSYNAIKRSGIDASVYLNWLQLQNKNILDFSLMLGSVNTMVKEELMFKDFLIGLDVFEAQNESERRSSEYFYRLQKKIRRTYETRKI